MPIYEYICKDCKKPFEKLVRKASEKISCPQCGSRRHTMQYSVVAAPAKSGNGSSVCERSGGEGCGGCPPGGCGCH